jgi:hypothetical protein
VEVLHIQDNREMSVGKKRNQLLRQAQGRLIAFVDDDDDISDQYITKIESVIKSYDVDSIGINGIITTEGRNAKKFYISREYEWEDKKGIYLRFPNHITPIRREIAVQFKFPDINCGEDYDWSMKIKKSGLLRSEVKISDPLYFYKFSKRHTATQ